MLLTILKYLDMFLVGWLAGWLVFDYRFHRPLRKMHKTALNEWKKTLDMAMDLATDKAKTERENQPILSPIQIRKI